MGLPMALVVLITVAYLGLVAPFTGRRSYQRLVADPSTLLGFYRRNVVRKWALAIPVALAPFLWPGLRPEDLGLVWPSGAELSVAVGATLGLAVLLAFSVVQVSRMLQSGRTVGGLQRVRGLVPRTRAEQAWAWAAFTSAAIVEELVMRGLLFAAGRSLGLATVVVLLATSALFGLAHLYQGGAAIIATGMLGAVFGALLWLTGSLYPAIAVHFLVDARALLILQVVGRSTSDGAHHDGAEAHG
jgi:membrane protease YdiL (CAAX protease family)